MKKTVLALGISTLLGASTGMAAERIGLGFIAGTPTGLSAKLPLSGINTLNCLAGWNLYGNGRGNNNGALYLNGDYIWNDFGLIPVTQGKLAVYYGPGAHVTVASNIAIGVRGMAGILYQFSNAPLEVLFEVGPSINILTSTSFGFCAGLGMRFLL